MTKYVIPEQLIGKEVITSDGIDLGKFLDIDFNEVTGKLVAMIVEPNPDSDLAKKLQTSDGKLRIPYENVWAVNDYIIVDRKGLG